MDGTNMTPSDVIAMTNGNGMGGNMWIWLIVILLLFNGGGAFFNRGMGEFGQYATSASQQDILFSSKFQALDNKIDRIGYGLCDSTYALNNAIHGAQDTVAGAVIGEGRGIQMQIGAEARGFQQQVADCCCTTNRNIDNVRYDAQKNVGELMAVVHAENEKTRALIQQNEVQTLRDKVQDLQFQQSQCAQNAYLINTLRPYPAPAYPATNLFGYNGFSAGCHGGYQGYAA